MADAIAFHPMERGRRTLTSEWPFSREPTGRSDRQATDGSARCKQIAALA
ncbi:hypothetical protein [Paraburkholderia hospita]|jgi:hypothetical protein|nr:hypothetical protein [Paraburkholderia hospita]